MGHASNIINRLNSGFDNANPKHRRLFNGSVGAWAFAFGATTGASAGLASQEAIDTSIARLYNAAMDAQLSNNPDLWDVVRNVDIKGLGERSLDHFMRIGTEATRFPGEIIPALKEGGAVANLTDGLKSNLTMAANDMAGGVQSMELAGNLLILGSIAVAGGAALAWGDKLRRRFFVKSSDEYFEYRKKLLVNGIAVRSDIDATRQRAVDAYARLLAFDQGGHEGRVQEEHIARSREFLEQYEFGALLEKIELTASSIYDNRSEERFMARKEGRNPDEVGTGKLRDIVREVIFDTMPDAEVVDPFDTMLRPRPEEDPDPDRENSEDDPQV